jgi:iron complex transport system permease protein
LAIVAGVALPGIPQAWIIPASAFVFAAASTMMIQALAASGRVRTETLVLFGIAIMFAANAGLALMQFIASAQALQQLVFWTLGGLTRARWDQIGVLAVLIMVILPMSMRASDDLNALTFGEDRARSFGVDVSRLRVLTFLRIALLTAAAVAFVGTIAFIGLVAPHMARLLVGPGHRHFLPASALAGALVMSVAAIGSKMLVPGVVIPVGIVTSMVGVPVFLLLILAKGHKR